MELHNIYSQSNIYRIMVTKNTILESLTSQKKVAEGELSSLKEADFPNPLDFIFTKNKKEGYVNVLNEAIVILNKSDNIINYAVEMHKKIDDNISTGKVKDGKIINVGMLIVERKSLPISDDVGGDAIDDFMMKKKGINSGKISAYTDLSHLIDEIDGENAASNAHKHHQDKTIPVKADTEN